MELSPEQVRAIRIGAQKLEPRADRGALVETVRAVCGIQAQLTPAMLLALRARIHGLTLKDVQTAIDPDRQLVRTWAMRGTLHLLPRDDVGWIVGLLGPVFAAKDKRRRLQLGLTNDLCHEGLAAIGEILSEDGALTRGELVERLAERGIVVERKSQAPIHLIAYAALEGIVCLGPDRPNGESTYVYRDRWLGPQPAPDRDAALAELVRRYLDGYGPASRQDFASWSGLSLAEAKKGWQLANVEANYSEVRLGNLTLWMSKTVKHDSQQLSPVVRLLPAFDTYLLGYANRDQVVRPEHLSEVYHGGQIVPVVLVDGLAAGVWRYERKGKRLTINVRPFDSIDAAVQQGIAEEAEDIGRYFGSAVSVTTLS